MEIKSVQPFDSLGGPRRSSRSQRLARSPRQARGRQGAPLLGSYLQGMSAWSMGVVFSEFLGWVGSRGGGVSVRCSGQIEGKTFDLDLQVHVAYEGPLRDA